MDEEDRVGCGIIHWMQFVDPNRPVASWVVSCCLVQNYVSVAGTSSLCSVLRYDYGNIVAFGEVVAAWIRGVLGFEDQLNILGRILPHYICCLKTNADIDRYYNYATYISLGNVLVEQ
jgi:hypothetical protein